MFQSHIASSRSRSIMKGNEADQGLLLHRFPPPPDHSRNIYRKALILLGLIN